MFEQEKPRPPAQLPDLLAILWAARIDTTANRFHMVTRAIPHLKTMAENSGDAGLHKAVEHAEAAITHLDTMVEELRTAIDYIQPRQGARQTA